MTSKIFKKLMTWIIEYSDVRVGILFEIPISLDLSLVFILLIAAIEGLCRHGFLGALFSSLCFIFFYLSVFGHELGHALIAKSLAIVPLGIQIMPLFGLTKFQKEASPVKAILIAGAGPLANFVMALMAFLPLLSFGGWAVVGEAYNSKSLLAPSFAHFLAILVLLNLVLGLFNLLPVYPFDGGRMVQSTLLICLPKNRALHLSAIVTQAVSFGVFIWGCWTFNLLTCFFMAMMFGFARIQKRDNPWNLEQVSD